MTMAYDAAQVYAPEVDTFLLRDAALAEVKSGDRVLEIGTGSGLIAAALEGQCGIVATDINPHAVRAAREKGVEVVRCDLAAGIRGPFDLILFNPPYLPTQKGERIDDWLEYALDGGTTGRATIEQFAADVARVLAPHGRILLIISSLTGTREVFEFFQRHGFTSGIVRRQPVEDEELYVVRIVADHSQERRDQDVVR
jgi:release factor glutamine methyltransferase